jgi:hypothetical protein
MDASYVCDLGKFFCGKGWIDLEPYKEVRYKIFFEGASGLGKVTDPWEYEDLNHGVSKSVIEQGMIVSSSLHISSCCDDLFEGIWGGLDEDQVQSISMVKTGKLGSNSSIVNFKGVGEHFEMPWHGRCKWEFGSELLGKV